MMLHVRTSFFTVATCRVLTGTGSHKIEIGWRITLNHVSTITTNFITQPKSINHNSPYTRRPPQMRMRE